MSVTHFTFPAIILKWNQPVRKENLKLKIGEDTGKSKQKKSGTYKTLSHKYISLKTTENNI